jgi:hypothetical protein
MQKVIGQAYAWLAVTGLKRCGRINGIDATKQIIKGPIAGFTGEAAQLIEHKIALHIAHHHGENAEV